jgi:hypothetical protein
MCHVIGAHCCAVVWWCTGIPPNEYVTVECTYIEPLEYQNGRYNFNCAMAFAPGILPMGVPLANVCARLCRQCCCV